MTAIMSHSVRKYAYVGKSHQDMLDFDILEMIDWRAGDIVISGPPKCGTNWAQQMVHQLRTGGDTEFISIRAVIPVVGHVKVNITREQELAQFASLPAPRALKTHFGPPVLPLRPEVRYVVVLRDILDIPVSLMAFSNAFSDASRRRTGMPTYEDLHHLMDDFDDLGFYFAFLNGWLEHASAANVLFLHYRNMKADLPGTLRRLGRFCGIEVENATTLRKVEEYCSFPWMKEHQLKFEVNWDGTPMVTTGNLIRRGEVGRNRQELPDDIRLRLEQLRQERVPARYRSWVAEGGEFPDEQA